jgi:DNA-binding transcriptional MerR regulator
MAENADTDLRIGIHQLLNAPSEDVGAPSSYRIGDLAREFGVSLRTLRFYEGLGLLSPQRRGTTRLYSKRDRMRLRLVLLGKLLGFSLTEAKQIIEIYDEPNGRRRQLERALERFEQQREILLDQRRDIEESIEAMDVSLDFVRRRIAENY